MFGIVMQRIRNETGVVWGDWMEMGQQLGEDIYGHAW